MATGTSIVGTWNYFIDWGCDGSPAQIPLTFNADGTMTYQFGSGHWIQVEGMMAFTVVGAENLVYTANVSRDSMVGIHGYVQAAASSGCHWAVRQTAATAEAARAAVETDMVLGPQK